LDPMPNIEQLQGMAFKKSMSIITERASTKGMFILVFVARAVNLASRFSALFPDAKSLFWLYKLSCKVRVMLEGNS